MWRQNYGFLQMWSDFYSAAQSLQVKLTYKKHGMFSCKLQPLRSLDLSVFLKQKRDRGFLRAAGWSCRLLWLSEEWRKLDEERSKYNQLHNLLRGDLNRTVWVIFWLKKCNVLMSYKVFLSVKLIQAPTEKQLVSDGYLNSDWDELDSQCFQQQSARASHITKATLTLSILFPTSIFTRSFLVQYVSSSLSQLSSLVKVSWRVTSYTAPKQKHIIRRARTPFTHNITKCTCSSAGSHRMATVNVKQCLQG